MDKRGLVEKYLQKHCKSTSSNFAEALKQSSKLTISSQGQRPTLYPAAGIFVARFRGERLIMVIQYFRTRCDPLRITCGTLTGVESAPQSHSERTDPHRETNPNKCDWCAIPFFFLDAAQSQFYSPAQRATNCVHTKYHKPNGCWSPVQAMHTASMRTA